MKNSDDSFGLIDTKKTSQTKPVVYLLVIISIIIFWSGFCWSIGFFMAKQKFKTQVIITIPSEIYYQASKADSRERVSQHAKCWMALNQKLFQIFYCNDNIKKR